MGRMQREKGKVGERELSKELTRLFGEHCRRSVQFCGDAGDSDVVGLEGLFIESKRVQRLNVPAAVEKAVEQCPAGEIPIVCHRANRQPWLVTLRLDDLPELAVRLFHVLSRKNS